MFAMASCLCCISLLMFCAVVAAVPAIDSDLKEILDFMSVMSGRWSNMAQIEAGSTQHDLIEGYVRPVKVPALGYKHVLFTEQAINNRVILLNVMEVKVDATDKNRIYMIPYEFANTSNYKSGEFKVEDLLNLTRDQLKHDPDCVDNLVRISEGVYSGICAICKTMIGGRYPGYAVTLTCDECTGAIPLSVPAKASSIPYVFRLTGPKFPLIDPPPFYTSPCDKKLESSTKSTTG